MVCVCVVLVLSKLRIISNEQRFLPTGANVQNQVRIGSFKQDPEVVHCIHCTHSE